MSVILYKAGESHLESLIHAGKYDDSSDWSFGADDENALLGDGSGNWPRYGSVHLGEDTGETPNTKERYKYPGAKADGDSEKVYRSGLIAAKQRAGQQGDRDIEAAAGKLIDLIDAKSGKRNDPDSSEAAPRSDSAAHDSAAQMEGAGVGVILAHAMRDLPRLATRIVGTPLMVAQTKLDVILGVLGPRIRLAEIADVGLKAVALMADGSAIAKPKAMEASEAASSTAPAPYVTTPDGFAIIPIEGSLVNKSSFIGAVSGMASYGTIGAKFATALADPAVRGILLEIDSYGGECSGLFDLADAIFAARQQKPVYAAVNDSAFSAAYLLASAANKVILPRTGGVGSIGVVALHTDQSGADAKDGMRYEYVFAGDRKVDMNPHEPLSSDARALLQARIDSLYGMFVGAVAQYRQMSADALKATQAGLFFGSDAVKSGLADAIGTTADALAALKMEAESREKAKLVLQTAPPSPNAKVDTPLAEGAKTAEVVDLAKVRGEGAAEMLARATEIRDICKLAGMADIAGDLIAQGMTVEQARAEVQTRRAARSQAHSPSSHISVDAEVHAPVAQQSNEHGWGRAHAVARGATLHPASKENSK